MPTPKYGPDHLEVLVVDDDPQVRELLVEYFRARGFRVDSATDGRAAVAELRRSPGQYGLILTDLHLPGVDGLAVLEAARAADRSACVVIITGYASLDSAVRAVRLGAYDYLTKPFSLGQIDVLLQRIAERRALETENRTLSKSAPAVPAYAPPSPAAPGDRLARIENRLGVIETLLRDLVAQLGARRP
jgi:DNA-binding NtrC family response regulator